MFGHAAVAQWHSALQLHGLLFSACASRNIITKIVEATSLLQSFDYYSFQADCSAFQYATLLVKRYFANQ